MKHAAARRSKCDVVLISLGLVLLAIVQAKAWADPVASQRVVAFPPGEGLAGDVIRSITRTPDGDMWFACWGRGVSRYDGYIWTSYDQRDGLPTLDVRALAVDSQGRLWCGTTLGIAYFDGTRWQNVSTGIAGNDSPSIFGIASSEDGALWFIADQSKVLCFSPASHVTDVTVPPVPQGEWRVSLDTNALGAGAVRSILPVGGEELWAAVDGIGILEYTSGHWAPQQGKALPGDIVALAGTPSGQIWAAGRSFVVDLSQSPHTVVPLAGDGLTCIGATDNMLYAGTNEGILCYDGHEWSSNFIGDAPSSVPILAVFCQDPDNVWAGGRYGAYRVTSNEWMYIAPEPDDVDHPVSYLYTDMATPPIVLDGLGRLYMRSGEEWRVITQVNAAEAPSYGMSVPRDGAVWCLFANGIFQVSLNEQRVTATLELPELDGTPQVYCGPGGRLFVFGGSTVYERVGASWDTVRRDTSQKLESILEDSSGTLWLLWSEHCERRKEGAWADVEIDASETPGAIESIAETRTGALLVGVAGRGVFALEGDKLEALVSFDGASSNQTSVIYQANDGTIFVGNRQTGVSSYNDGFWTTHLEPNGVPSGRVSFVGQDPQGSIWAEIQGAGIVRYRPGTSVAKTRIDIAPHLIAYKESAAFQFSATDMWKATPEKDLRYSWRILAHRDGAVVRDWSPFSANRTAVVSPLRPGAYEFQVVAMNRARNLGAPSALAAFEVAGPFWAQAVFYIPVTLLALVIAALGWFSFRKHVSLGEAEARYRGILNAISEVVFSLSPDGSVAYVSPALESILGFRPDDVVGTSLARHMEPSDAQRFHAWLSTVDHDEVTREEYRFIGHCGALRWLRLSCHVVFRDGNAVYVHGVGTDITQLKSAEESLRATLENQEQLIGLRTREVNATNTLLTQEVEFRRGVENALRQSEEQLRLIIERCPLAMLISSECGDVEYANSQFVQIFGFALEEVPNLDQWWRAGQNEFDADVSHVEVRAWRSGRGNNGIGGPPEPEHNETRLRCKNGHVRIVETRCTNIASKWLLILNDITERRSAEERERMHREQVLQAGKLMALGTLVSGVAHEINNPNHIALLAVSTLDRVWRDVQGMLERIGLDEDNVFGGLHWGEVRQQMPLLLGRLKHSSERIGGIVRDLRTYAVPDAEHVKEEIDLSEVAQSAAAWMGPLVAESTQSFCLDCAQDLPTIMGNRRRLEQVMVNLIQNACQALQSSDGEVRVQTSYDRTSGMVVVDVVDSGRGMEAEVAKHVTDPFFTTKRAQGGTGLGLSISATIVREHGGELTFSSAAGKGTTARMALPVIGQR